MMLMMIMVMMKNAQYDDDAWVACCIYDVLYIWIFHLN